MPASVGVTGFRPGILVLFTNFNNDNKQLAYFESLEIYLWHVA